MRTRMRRDAIYRRLLAISDIVALIAALVLGGIVSGASATPFVLLSLPALIITAKVLGLYDRDQHLIRRTTLDEAPKLFQVATF